MVDGTVLLRTRITGHFQRSLSKGRLSVSPLLDLICASTFCERDGCFLLLGFGCENIFFLIFLSYYIFHLFIWNKYRFYKNLQYQLLAYARQSWTKVPIDLCSISRATFFALIGNVSLRAPYSGYGDSKEPRPRSRSPMYGRDGREPRDSRDGREPRDSRDGRDPGREPRPGGHSRDPDYRYRSSESRDKDLRGDPRDPPYRWLLTLKTLGV